MSPQVEQVVNGRMHTEESLRLLDQFEPPHTLVPSENSIVLNLLAIFSNQERMADMSILRLVVTFIHPLLLSRRHEVTALLRERS